MPKDSSQPLVDNIGLIRARNIEAEMQESYLDYAMSVIVSRALPDVRDGLKPVHRRILYVMHENGLRHNVKYRKSADTVGSVLGRYHPHGDASVYDAMVHMAQDFSMRYPLIDGQGNFGSMDGDGAAAYRYTEARMSALAEELLVDLDKETVDWRDNYDATKKEPSVLPGKLPNLLLNGTLGIAVGMATDIPSHNLGEIVDAIVKLIDEPEATTEDLMEFVKGPDFPTGGIIYDIAAIKNAYATGKGGIVMRAKTEITETKTGSFQILVHEIPYRVNKATLLEKIAELVRDKKIEGIRDVRDESDKDGVRIVVDLKKESLPNKILNQLFSFTQLQETFHMNLLALVDGIEPHVLNLKTVLENYLTHRQIVIKRRTAYELKKAKEREHILEGLSTALDHIDEVISIIRKSPTKEEAKVNLMKKFKLTEIQTDAILEMRLQTLAGLERKKIEDELKEKKILIAELEGILHSAKKILGIIKKEIIELKEKFGDERRTAVVKNAVGSFSAEDLIPEEGVIITITKSGYVKRMAPDVYKSQSRGGKGVIGQTLKEEDVVERLISAVSHDDILFFTNKGRAFQTKVYELPEGSRIAKGQALVNFLQLGAGEVTTAVLTLSKKGDAKFLIMATRNGLIKKVPREEFAKVRRSGMIAISLKGDDELRWVETSTGEDQLMLSTQNGQAIRFKEKDVRPMGRTASGVTGMRIKKDDQMISMDIIRKDIDAKDLEVLIVTENGLGKKTELSFYKIQNRAGSGIKTLKVTPKTGKIVTMYILNTAEEHDLVVISKAGQTIRLPLASVSTLGRATQGVRIMKLDDADKVASATII
jgi:DNA gyrase subunit A